MQKTENKTALVWFRNDLRVHDNTVLHEACTSYERVIGVYCFDPRLFNDTLFGFKKTEKFRAHFLLQTLHDLKIQLEAINITLFTYISLPEHIIPKLCKDYDVNSVIFQKEWTQEERNVELEVATALNNSDVELRSFYNQFLFHPDDIDINADKVPNVFTAFRKKLEKYSSVRETLQPQKKDPKNLIPNNTTLPSLNNLGFDDPTPHTHSAFPFSGGETQALQRLEHYFFETKKVGYYKKTRNGLLGTDYSTKFSPWLANGSLSPRTVYWKVKQFEREFFKNESTYWVIFELIWRDYFKYISLKYGNKIFQLGGILERTYEWSSNETQVKNWIEGNTREPFVNANMMELKETGWMSNRGRQNVASYFAKELHLDWRIGAAYFESLLLDYDV
ncbi:MAG: DASH family cryptochrome, partial [Bacteroidota bacterium]